MMKKKILCLVLSLGLVVSAIGCGKEADKNEYPGPSISVEEIPKTEVLKVGDKTVYLDEVYLYAIQCAYLFDVNIDTYLESQDTYDKMILSQIREANIMYQVAVDAGVEITDDHKAEAKAKSDSYIKTVGQDILDKYGITKERVEEIFLQQYYYTVLTNQVTIELNNKYKDLIKEEYKDKEVNQFYVVNIPYIEVDENNAAITDAEGNNKLLSTEEKSKKQALAEEVASVINNTNYTEILKEYGLTAFSAEKWIFSGDSETDAAKEAEKLEVGGVTDIYDDGSKCYYFLIMLDKANKDYKESFYAVFADSKTSEELEILQASWLQSVEVDDVNDIIGDTWKSLDFKYIISYFNDMFEDKKQK